MRKVRIACLAHQDLMRRGRRLFAKLGQAAGIILLLLLNAPCLNAAAFRAGVAKADVTRQRTRMLKDMLHPKEGEAGGNPR